MLDALVSIFDRIPHSISDVPLPILSEPSHDEHLALGQCALLEDALELQSVLSLFDALLCQRATATTTSPGLPSAGLIPLALSPLQRGMSYLAARCARALPLSALAGELSLHYLT